MCCLSMVFSIVELSSTGLTQVRDKILNVLICFAADFWEICNFGILPYFVSSLRHNFFTINYW